MTITGECNNRCRNIYSRNHGRVQQQDVVKGLCQYIWYVSNSVFHSCAGVTSEKELLSPDNKVHPDYYTDSLPDLLSVKQKVKA